MTIGVVSAGPDAAMTHASDGYADVVIARKGGLGATAGLLMRYVGKYLCCGLTDERDSELFDYVKARSITLAPDEPGSSTTTGAGGGAAASSSRPSTDRVQVNVDGEVLPGPGPFRIYLLPSLLTAYGQY